MGSKRVGLARTQSLIENLKRELSDITGIEGPRNTTQFYGDGFVSGSTTPPTSKTVTINDEIITTVTLDLTNLSASAGSAGLAIGNKEGGVDDSAPAYLLQYAEDDHGIVYKVEMSCVETPAGSSADTQTDIDLKIVGDATKIQGASVGGTTVINSSTLAKGGTVQTLTPALTSGQYFYLTNGATVAAAASANKYNAGKLIVRLYGHADF